MNAGPSIHLSIGTSGSGKTFGMRKTVEAYARVIQIIVIDQMAEWSSVPEGVNFWAVRSVRDAIAIFKKNPTTPGLAIVRGESNVAEAFDRACKWAVRTKTLRGVACSEVHIPAPVKRDLLPNVMVAATQYRHWRTVLFLDTQRLALMNTTLRDQADVDVKIYSVVGPRDIDVIKTTWGPEVEAAVRECAQRFIAGGGRGGTGAGWYVRPNVPPYTIARNE